MVYMKQLYTEQQEATRAMKHNPLSPPSFEDAATIVGQLPMKEREICPTAAFAMYMELRLQRQRWLAAGGDEDAIASIDRVLGKVQ